MKAEFILFNQVNGNSVNNKKLDNNFGKVNINFSEIMDNSKENFKANESKVTQKNETDYTSGKDANPTNPIDNLKNSDRSLLLEKEKKPKSIDLTLAELESIAIFLKDLSNSISEKVVSALSISQEELEEMFETLGFTPLDLLNKDNATDLFLHVNEDIDSTNLITNEDLMSQYNSFMEILDDTQVIINELEARYQKMDFVELFDDLISNNESEYFQIENSKTENNNLNLQDQVIQLDDNADKDISLTKQDNSEMFGTKQLNNQKDSDSINFIVDNQKPKSNEQDTSTQYQTNNEVLNNFSNKLNSTISNNKIFSSNDNSVNDIFDISRQIIEQIKVKLQPDQTSIEMKLYPEHLGKLTFEVKTESGILTANFTTENEVTKEILESQLHILKEQLNLQGLKVEDVEVEVGISQFSTNEDGDSNSSRPKQNQGQKNLSNFWSGIEEDNSTSSITLDNLLISYDLDDVNKNTVNYSA